LIRFADKTLLYGWAAVEEYDEFGELTGDSEDEKKLYTAE